MKFSSRKRRARQTGMLPTLLLTLLCLVTSGFSNVALAVEQNRSLTGNERFTLNGYADIFKANGSGTLIAASSAGQELGVCPLRHTDVTANISGYVARVTVKQVFENSYKEDIEAIYTFPLSDTSAVDEMVMQIGNRTIHGTIKKRDEAAQIYSEAKLEGKAAALLQQQRSNIFTQSVANVRPGEKIAVTLKYIDLLPFQNGRFVFAFPTVVGPRFIPGNSESDADHAVLHTRKVRGADCINPPISERYRSGHDISINVFIDAGVPINKIRSQLHEVSVNPLAENRAAITLRNQTAIPNKDFVLSWNVAQDTLMSSYLAHRAESDKKSMGYFTLMLFPPKRITSDSVAPREMIFVVDRSGSQEGAPLEKAKETLKYIVAHMNRHDTFQIVTFSDVPEFLFDKPQPANALSTLHANQIIDRLHADGGTQIFNTLEAICKIPTDPRRLRIVTLMTDGLVGDDNETINLVRKYRGSSRWFTFGTGNSVNRHLIDGVAKAGGGEPDYVYLNSPGEVVAKKFYEKIATPLLTNVRLSFKGLAVSEIFPNKPSDVWDKRPLYFQGRYSKGGTGSVTLSGLAGGRPYSRTMSVDLPGIEPENAALESTWARAKVDELLEEMEVNTRRQSTQDAIATEITNVALAHHIITDYTSFVAVDETASHSTGNGKTVVVPVELPEGTFGSAPNNGTVGAPVAPSSRFQYAPNQYTPYSSAPSGGSLCGGLELVDAPVAPRYGQSNEVGMLWDYGYDTHRDLLRLATIAIAIASFIFAIWEQWNRKRKLADWKNLTRIAIMVFGIPFAFHLVGTVLINAFGPF